MLLANLRARSRHRHERHMLDALQCAEGLLPDALEDCPTSYSLRLPEKSVLGDLEDWSLDWNQGSVSWQRLTKRFGCAILSGGTLCGLAMGKFNGSGRILNIYMMEGNPDRGHPFKGYVLDTVELVALISCRLSGASELRLIDPVEGVVGHYTDKGYALVPGDQVLLEAGTAMNMLADMRMGEEPGLSDEEFKEQASKQALSIFLRDRGGKAKRSACDPVLGREAESRKARA